ncbi:hypothetical protein FGO68_gene6507 [Halteria grandinella]|uniref:Uncharacterized protein n=1 Tax=Halteria grandinella TaxID=5974 RepID=A0A8J8N9G2_HALGN|nr:hypothetical protein FGO68_gene6507 [Halteria grandinella]
MKQYFDLSLVNFLFLSGTQSLGISHGAPQPPFSRRGAYVARKARNLSIYEPDRQYRQSQACGGARGRGLPGALRAEAIGLITGTQCSRQSVELALDALSAIRTALGGR